MSEHSKPTQNQRILDYIEETGGITQLEALNELGVMRLASRISDLRKRGHKITSECSRSRIGMAKSAISSDTG